MNIVYEQKFISYDINLAAVNNYYYMINSGTLPLESIVFIEISQYLLDQFDKFESYNNSYLRYLHYLKTYYNNNYILYTNNNPYAINNKENKSENFIARFTHTLHLKAILYCSPNTGNLISFIFWIVERNLNCMVIFIICWLVIAVTLIVITAKWKESDIIETRFNSGNNICYDFTLEAKEQDSLVYFENAIILCTKSNDPLFLNIPIIRNT